MPPLTTEAKIAKLLNEQFLPQVLALQKHLNENELILFEGELYKILIELFNNIAEILIQTSAEDKLKESEELARSLGCKKLQIRTFTITILTGLRIKTKGIYIKKIPSGWNGSRFMLAHQWKIIGGASPGLYDRVGYFTALCPSYDIAKQALNKIGCRICTDSVYKISKKLANYCYGFGEEKLVLSEKETLADKRVVISLDGGRTRTRMYTGTKNQKGNMEYDTDWREPKLFTITILDKDGSVSKTDLPIYGCRFLEDAVLELLKRFLVKLEIHKARLVQVVADGATWIWNTLKPLLMGLGLEEERIVETLDYYHAAEYVHQIVAEMPSWVSKKDQKDYLKLFLDLLWNGKSDEIVAICRRHFNRGDKNVWTWLNYLEKHINRTQYADYKINKLMCGSGIIESAIRRVINLRFKGAATFWYKECVEKMYFLRSAFLSGRWGIFMQNVVNAC
jgi:hypothetical protein